ncbi:NAD(P)H-dependent glycerol-3-phosphate dehydrogenase [Brevirhabdus sp.]|uniref:NAD(P)H-dependent glycerol-3-phosphate dehydrogenase n=1 Tax=Brevirhabdus sp. TaxID=2004514 RepID=UPI004059765B
MKTATRSVDILGAGAFGTALGIALANAGVRVTIWARDRAQIAAMQADGVNAKRLPGVALPSGLTASHRLSDLTADILLVSLPAQTVAPFLETHGAQLSARRLVACCKGVDLNSGLGPSGVIRAACPEAVVALLTGPSFAADIARGLPTALTLACADAAQGAALQQALSTPVLRLYRTTDMAGAEMGGALKNVMAIACGMAIGAGMGESARAALMTRGFAEMQRFALWRGAQPETLAGLSGFGDLVLTCTSALSRNFSFGVQLGRGEPLETQRTVEGRATARAVSRLAQREGLDLPITTLVDTVLSGGMDLKQAAEHLLARPLKEE